MLLGGLMTIDGGPGAWIKWWLGDMMGVLVVAPLLLVWLGRQTSAMTTISSISAARWFEAVVLSAAVLCVSYIIFGAPELAGRGYYPAALAVFPFVIWSALRFGQRGASLLTLSISVLAV